MGQNNHNSLTAATCIHDVDCLKGWIDNGSLALSGWMVDHVLQPADEIVIPAIPEHVLVIDISGRDRGSDRQVRRIAGQEYDGKGLSNNFAIIPSGMPSEFAWDGEDEAVNFGFRPQTLRKTALETECINPDNIELKPMVSGQDPQITRLTHAILHEMCTGGEGTLLFAQSLLTAFSIHLLRHYCVFEAKLKNLGSGLSQKQLQRTLDYIRTCIEESTLLDDLSLSDLAEQACLSEYYFSRQFKVSTGETPAAFVCKLRMEKAAGLLNEQPQKTIGAIASEVGYVDPASFAKAFRRFIGVTPSTYRRKSR
ncbi:MAG: helix-turn-helix domain-containing protein [Cyanobacteria bacterium P01_A01_bin.37]